ncbi:GGDEF domain-containing protein [bacterium]|nr:GGDEF domain-containing protein [bacterium]
MTKIINSALLPYALGLLFIFLSEHLKSSTSFLIVLWGLYFILLLYLYLVEKAPLALPAYIPPLVVVTGGMGSPLVPLLFLALPYTVAMGEVHFFLFVASALGTLVFQGDVHNQTHFYLYGVFVLAAATVYFYSKRSRFSRFLSKSTAQEEVVPIVSEQGDVAVADPFLPLRSYFSRMTSFGSTTISIKLIKLLPNEQAQLFDSEQSFALKGLIRRAVTDRVVSTCSTVLGEKDDLPMMPGFEVRVYYPINLFDEEMHTSSPEYVIVIDADKGLHRNKIAAELRPVRREIIELLKMGETFSHILQERKNKERLYQGTKKILDAFERESVLKAGAWSLFTLESEISAILITVAKDDSHEAFLYKQMVIGDDGLLSLDSIARTAVGSINKESLITKLLDGKLGTTHYVKDVDHRKEDKRLFQEPSFEELNRCESAYSVRLVYNEKAKGTISLFMSKKAEKDFNRHVDSVKLLSQALAVAFNNIEMYEKVEELSNIDGLTGLQNRRSFQETIDRMSAEASRTKQPLSLVMLDIDHFKKVNDTYGHKAGDDVIRFMARILKGSIRKVDIAARYGGEEFVLVLHNTPIEGAYELADKLRKNIQDSRIPADGNNLSITSSFGVSVFPDRAKNGGDLVKTADTALYFSKENGRNSVTKYADDMGDKPDD